MVNLVGQQLGNYHLVRHLGSGSFADVYLGKHTHLETLCAIKVLNRRHIYSDMDDFRNEAKLIASLDHPHIVKVLDFDIENHIPFFVMTYVPNGSLRQLHPKGTRLSLATTIVYTKEIASALQYAEKL